MMLPKRPKANTLQRMALALLCAFTLTGCSFDASKLRASAKKDAALAAPPADGAPNSGSVDGPPALADGFWETSVIHGDDAAVDMATTDAPAEAQSGHPETTSVVPEVGFAVDISVPDTILQPDAEMDLANPGDDAALTYDGPPDLASGAGGTLDVPVGSGGVDMGGAVTILDGASSGGTGGLTDDGGMDATATGGLVGSGGTSGSGGSGGSSKVDARPDSGPANAITEHPLPPGSALPWFLTVGPDNNLWIAEHTSGKIAKYTIADGKFKEFQAVAAGVTIEGITLGADSNLWFTEYSTDKVARMSTSGSVVEFGVTPNSGPDAIVAGLDGNVWFTEMGGNRIGSMSSTGGLSEYPINTANSQPARIAVSSDNNLWFTEWSTSRIGCLVPTAPTPTVSWATKTAAAQPSGIVFGPDGNLWVYEASANLIGRMTTAGVMEEFSIPTPNSAGSRGSITLGPDNNLWFTEYSGNKIGRITPSGLISEFPIATKNSSPMGIVAGPDGNLWFVEADGNKLASIAP